MGVQKAQSDLEADISLNFVGDEEPKVRSEHVQVEEHIIFTLRTETIEGVNKRNLLVLFLHDQVNDSYAWSESKVLQSLALHGFSSLAFDLPSHGRSTGPLLQKSNERAEFLQKFLEVVRPTADQHLVLVGASMAGQFLIPFLNLKDRINPVAVVGIGLSDAYELDSQALLPKTLLIRGEMDTSIGLNASNAWRNYENVRQFVMPSEKHLCHLGNPRLFNKILINFLNSISSS